MVREWILEPSRENFARSRDRPRRVLRTAAYDHVLAVDSENRITLKRPNQVEDLLAVAELLYVRDLPATAVGDARLGGLIGADDAG